jgi:hypothetical protein
MQTGSTAIQAATWRYFWCQLNRSPDMVWRVTNQNTAGQRICHGFFDTRFALECHLNSGCQPLIPS